MHNSKKINVLIFPCGSEIGLEINRALAYSTRVEQFGASSIPSNHGKYVYKNYIDNVPFVDDSEFIDKLNKIVKEYEIDFIFPAHDSVVLKLAECLDLIKCKVIGSPLETCKICRSKLNTYNYFKNIINSPEIFNQNSDSIKYPVFLKPDVGQGSKGVYLANTKEDIDFYLKKDTSLLILEYLPGAEYTVDCFTDRNGVLRFIGARQRSRTSNGISVNSSPVNDPEINKIAEIINKNLVFRGVWFFQLKKNDKDEYSLLEIAPRIAGTMSLHRNIGVNFALLSIFDAMDTDISICPNSYFIEVDRALISRYDLKVNYDNVYIDLDDTIIMQDKVNPFVVAFVYQCLNKNKNIILISRHKEDIEQTLKKYRLNNIFNNIVHIKEGQEKADFITEKLSIFIDDSFTEREKVKNKLDIPVFDVNSIEALLDWRI